MSQVRLACGLPFCQNPKDIQTNLSIGLRITVVALGTLAVVIGALILFNIPGLSHLGTTVGWTFVSIGTFLILIGISVKGVKNQSIIITNDESQFRTSESQNHKTRKENQNLPSREQEQKQNSLDGNKVLSSHIETPPSLEKKETFENPLGSASYNDESQFRTSESQNHKARIENQNLPSREQEQKQNSLDGNKVLSSHIETPPSLEKKEILENPLINKCLELYKKNEDAWVMVPIQKELKKGKQPTIAIGSASYKGMGSFKIHISIDPTQMEQAIPIVLEALHHEGAPTVGLKFQTERMLFGDHQIGKEFALIFAADAEKREESSHAIEKLLLQIQAAFIEKGINPEKGLVLTVTTREQIIKLPEGQQPLEKRNLMQRKFDRQVPGSTYFYYRNEDFTAIADSEDWAISMGAKKRKEGKIMLFSEIDRIILKKPENAHNPLGVKDPFRNLRIS